MTTDSPYRGRHVLVTGSGGFIGSHLTEALVQAGAVVTGLVRRPAAPCHAGSRRSNDRHLPARTVSGDIEDADFVRSAVAGNEIFFHLAALAGVPQSYEMPKRYLRTNIEGTLNVLEAARHAGVSRIVHTSTSDVYGTPRRVPIDEAHPLQGLSPYSASKIGAEKLAESYARSFGMPVVVIRPFNTFGPRQSVRAFIPTVIFQALTRDVIELGALDPQRDMTFVSDTVSGLLLAGTASGIDGETINLGTGESHAMGALASRILALMNTAKPIRQSADRLRPGASATLEVMSDNRKARSLLGWAPRTSLDDGLVQTIAYVSGHLDLFLRGK